MAEGDSIWGYLKDAVNSIPGVGISAQLAWGQGNYDPTTSSPANAGLLNTIDNPDISAMDRVGTAINAVPGMAQVGHGVQWGADHFAPLKFVLELGNRTADSFFNAAQAEDDSDVNTSFFDGWRHGWDSWGTDQHVTAGQIVGASLQTGMTPNGLSTFTPQGVKDIQSLAKKTWFGDVAGAATDISAAFLVPLGPIKIARVGKTVDTVAQADRLTEVFNAGERAGRTGSFFKPNAPQSQATRLEALARDTLDHADSMTDVVNYLGPKTSSMGGRGQQVLAEIAVEAKKLGRDMGEHVMGNAYLAAMGSEGARAELMASAPLLAAKLANGTMAPAVFSDFAKAHSLMTEQYKATGAVRLDEVMSSVLSTPRKQAELTALQSALSKAKDEAVAAKTLRGRMAALRPRNRMTVNGQSFDLNADNLTIKEARVKAESQFKDLQGQLAEAKADLAGTQRWATGADKAATSRAAMQDAGAAAGSAAGRDAVATFGPFRDSQEFNQALGAARQKVDDLTAKLAEAKADHELLKSTPLDANGYTLPQWRADMAKSGRDAKLAKRKEDMLTALTRTAKRELAADAKAAREIMPGLNQSYDWLADIDALGRGELLPTLKLTPTMLDRAKLAYREHVGETYLYTNGDLNRRVLFHTLPNKDRWVANIGTAYGRSAINVLDRYVGAQELGMFLKKSRAFSGDEIRALTEQFHLTRPGQMEQFVSKVHDDMLERIVAREAPHMSPADVKQAVTGIKEGMNQNRSYTLGEVKKAEAEGAEWTPLSEFPEVGATDAIHNLPTPVLRSHLAETLPFADPVQLAKALKTYDGGIGRAGLNAVSRSVDGALVGWKLAQLMRPGLAVRNMLDTNLRAYSLMGTVPTMMMGLNGMAHFAKNSKIRLGDWVNSRGGTALERIAAQDPNRVMRNVMSATEIKVGGKVYKGSLYDLLDNGSVSATSLMMTWSAMTKGMSNSEGLMAGATQNLGKLSQSSKAWEIYRADSAQWHKAYANHAEVLLASPTARKMLEMETREGLQTMSLQQWSKEMFSDPKVLEEYNLLRQQHEMTPEMFLGTVLRETEIMFPEPGMAQQIMSGGFRGKRGEAWIESHFPKDQRFDIPGRESILNRSAGDFGRQVVNKIFRAIQDNPDFWLGRHPVAVNAFRTQFKKEAEQLLAARQARYGDSAELTSKDIAKIQQRSRNHAIGTVRDYMYDATRQTGASATVLSHRLVPFLAPFADTMRAYSRLIYDDPQRLFNMAGLYNVPFNLNNWTDKPFIVDEYGDRWVRGGKTPDSKAFVVINGQWSKDKHGVDRLVDGGIRLRASSFNTILQGEVPWLPGWGPAVQIPVNVALNNDKELALQLSSSDSPAVQTLMKSLFMDGEVPVTDESTLWKTMAPSWLRRFMDAKEGPTYGRNVAFLINAKWMQAQETGQPFNYQQALKESQDEATSAAFPLLVSQFGFGISGDAMVQGQFYSQKMKEFRALDTPVPGGGPTALEQAFGKGATPTGVFAAQFPEAKNLTWTFTRNETGINATVSAQSAALKAKGLIGDNPDLGWFIVGADNLGGEFSSTAYNQQKMDTYGATQSGRKEISQGEIAQQAIVSLGWDRFQQIMTELSNAQTSYGLDDNTVAAAKQALVQAVGQENPAWYAEYNDRLNKTQDFYMKADVLAKDPRMASRQDIAMYTTYRQAQQEVLDAMGLKSFAGTSQNAATARAAMVQIGTQMARQNLGFQQMWERVLYNDVKPTASDGKFGYVVPANIGE